MPGNQMKRQHPKEAAANRGCLSARHWSDIRQAMRLTRSEGGVLILHGVKVLPSDDAASESLLQSFQPAKNATRDARKPPKTEAVTGAGASTSKRLHAQQRSAQRLADYNEAKRAAACGARWQPIVQTVLSRSRAKQRAEVWTSWMHSKMEVRAKLRNLFLREWRRPHLEYKVPKPTPPGSRWQRLPTGHDLLSPLSYRDRHILNRAKNFVAVAAPHSRGTNKCAWAWLRLAYPYSDSDFDLENYGVNHAESPPPRAKKAKGKKSRGASSRRST